MPSFNIDTKKIDELNSNLKAVNSNLSILTKGFKNKPNNNTSLNVSKTSNFIKKNLTSEIKKFGINISNDLKKIFGPGINLINSMNKMFKGFDGFLFKGFKNFFKKNDFKLQLKEVKKQLKEEKIRTKEAKLQTKESLKQTKIFLRLNKNIEKLLKGKNKSLKIKESNIGDIGIAGGIGSLFNFGDSEGILSSLLGLYLGKKFLKGGRKILKGGFNLGGKVLEGGKDILNLGKNLGGKVLKNGKFLLKAIKPIAKKMPILGLVLGGADFLSGFFNAQSITGKEHNNFLENIGAGISRLASQALFGLVDEKTIYNWGNSICDIVFPWRWNWDWLKNKSSEIFEEAKKLINENISKPILMMYESLGKDLNNIWLKIKEISASIFKNLNEGGSVETSGIVPIYGGGRSGGGGKPTGLSSAFKNLWNGGSVETSGIVPTYGGGKGFGKSTPDSPEIRNVIKKGMEFYKSQGLTEADASAILGNFMAESTLNPNAINKKEGAHGLGQWRLDRFENLKKFAEKRGTSWNDLETQLAFVLEEFKGSKKGVANKFFATQDIAQKAEIFNRGYEVSADKTNKRQVHSSDIYNFVKGNNAENITENTKLASSKLQSEMGDKVNSYLNKSMEYSLDHFKYQYGAKGSSGYFDCSGLVSGIYTSLGEGLSQSLNDPNISKDFNKMFSSGSSDQMIKNIYEKTGQMFTGENLTSNIKEGMVLGVGQGKGGRYQGIGHVAYTYRDQKSGELMVGEAANTKIGMKSTPALEWLSRRKDVYGVDPLAKYRDILQIDSKSDDIDRLALANKEQEIKRNQQLSDDMMKVYAQGEKRSNDILKNNSENWNNIITSLQKNGGNNQPTRNILNIPDNLSDSEKFIDMNNYIV